MSLDQAFAGMPLGPLTGAPSTATRPSSRGREADGDRFLREGWGGPSSAHERTSASIPARHIGGAGAGAGAGGGLEPPQGRARGASVSSDGRCESITIDIPPGAHEEATCSTKRPLPRRGLFQRGHCRPHGER